MISIIFSPRILGVLEAFLCIFWSDWHMHLLSPINEIIVLLVIIGARKKVWEYLGSLFSSFLFIYLVFFIDYGKPLIFSKIFRVFCSISLNLGFVNTLILAPTMLYATRKSSKSSSEILSFFLISETFIAYLHILNNNSIPNLTHTPLNIIQGFYPMLNNLIADNFAARSLLFAYYRSFSFFFEWSYYSFFVSIINSNNNDGSNVGPIGYDRGSHDVLYFLLLLIISIYSNSIFLPITAIFQIQMTLLFLTLGYISMLGRRIVMDILYEHFNTHYFHIFFLVSMILRNLPAFANTQFLFFFFIFIYKSIENYL